MHFFRHARLFPPLAVIAGAALTLSGCGGSGVTQPGQSSGSSGKPLSAAAQTFLSEGCSGCHTLAAANAHGSIGPNLDESLPGKSESFIRTSIVDPDAEIAPGYSAGIMPTDFKSKIPQAKLEALVDFLHANAGK